MVRTVNFSSEFFDAESSVLCGQIFRYERANGGFYVYSGDKACLLRSEEENTYIMADEKDVPYFMNYFDTARDYSRIYRAAEEEGGVLASAAQVGKGIRIFNQNAFEALVCFIISQNNHIPRIRKIIAALCAELGDEREFYGKKYFTFPSPVRMAERGADFYRKIGAGYRAEYLLHTAQAVAGGAELTPETDLTRFRGVGQKVSDCVSLFAFHKTERFPVDTWLEKVYREDFGGKEKNRAAMTRFFEEKFGDNSGYFQQYLFYQKRGARGVGGE